MHNSYWEQSGYTDTVNRLRSRLWKAVHAADGGEAVLAEHARVAEIYARASEKAAAKGLSIREFEPEVANAMRLAGEAVARKLGYWGDAAIEGARGSQIASPQVRAAAEAILAEHGIPSRYYGRGDAVYESMVRQVTNARIRPDPLEAQFRHDARTIEVLEEAGHAPQPKSMGYPEVEVDAKSWVIRNRERFGVTPADAELLRQMLIRDWIPGVDIGGSMSMGTRRAVPLPPEARIPLAPRPQ